MKRLYLPILLLVLLLTQLGSLAHESHIHDSAENCDYCLSAKVLDHAVTPAIQGVIPSSSFQSLAEPAWMGRSEKGFHYYTARAPPHFI